MITNGMAMHEVIFLVVTRPQQKLLGPVGQKTDCQDLIAKVEKVMTS